MNLSPRPPSYDCKIRNIKFLSEMCKFGICPAGLLLDQLQQMCDQIALPNVPGLIVCLLENCGRFLLNTQETHLRTENLMDRMLRLKNSKNLGPRIDILLEDAYYQLKPPLEKMKREVASSKKSDLEKYCYWLAQDMLYRVEDVEDVVEAVGFMAGGFHVTEEQSFLLIYRGLCLWLVHTTSCCLRTDVRWEDSGQSRKLLSPLAMFVFPHTSEDLVQENRT